MRWACGSLVIWPVGGNGASGGGRDVVVRGAQAAAVDQVGRCSL